MPWAFGNNGQKQRGVGGCGGPRRGGPPHNNNASVSADRGRLGSFGTLYNTDTNRLALLQRGQAGTLEGSRVDEDVLTTGLWGDKAKALVGVVPFHRADHL